MGSTRGRASRLSVPEISPHPLRLLMNDAICDDCAEKAKPMPECVRRRSVGRLRVFRRVPNNIEIRYQILSVLNNICSGIAMCDPCAGFQLGTHYP